MNRNDVNDENNPRNSTDDLWLACMESGDDFCHTASAQRFFALKKFSTPKRCPTCARLKRQHIQERRSSARGWNRTVLSDDPSSQLECNSSKHGRWANTGRAGRPVGTTRKRAQEHQKTEHVVRTVANSNNST
jgi:hypothetical protein